MNRQDVINAAHEVWEDMRRSRMVPNPDTRYKTSSGNLALHALEFNVQGNLIDITVNESIAPYMPYTNEPWISDIWNGKKNPNEGWWDRFAAEFARRLAAKLNGSLELK